MSLRPDDRGSQRERSRTRDRSRSRYDDDEPSKSSSSKSKSKARFEDEDDEVDTHKSSSKSKSRSRYDDDDDDDQPRKSSSKSKSRRHENDDDDDEQLRKASSKSKSRSRYDDEDEEESPRLSKSKSHSRYEDEEEEPSARPSKSKSRPRFDDDPEEPSKASKSKSRSRHAQDDDDEEMTRVASQMRAKARFDDDNVDDAPTKKSPKSNKSLRFHEEDRSSVSMPSMPGGFDDDEAGLAYEDNQRQPGGRLPGLSSLIGGAGPNNRGRNDSDDESDSRRDSRKSDKSRGSRSSRQYQSEVRSPRDSNRSFFDQASVQSPEQSRVSFFDPEERVEEIRRPSRSHRKQESSGSLIPYPDAEHAFMPSIPTIPGDDHDYRMILPQGAERQYDYDDDDEHLAYTTKPLTRSWTDHSEEQSRPRPKSPSRSVSFPQPAVEPSDKQSRRASGFLSVGGSKEDGHQTSSRSRNGRLSVSTDRPNMGGSGKPPASPLLEPYHGTYQQISPMPSPMMLPETDDPDDLDEIEEFSLEERKPSSGSAHARKKSIDPKTGKKRVVLYDSEGDAEKLAKAFAHHDARPGPLIEVLPEVTHDQMLALRDQYKKRVKVAGRGVNLSKQIKATTTGNFGKIAYATSLGRWEAEAYWANFWYQSHSSNRELLIEALMGKPNAEIREINASFKDKRYQDDLSLCMEKELKPDKFRAAVLTALEARRQEETDVWPLDYRNQDVETLFRALKSRDGGESAILDIVVRRSDNHLREVLKTFERLHQENFARAALEKSNNLVGEVIAHILNGVINRPARDCLLLRHAIKDVTSKNKAVELRYELLMSRLIRLHWDRTHMNKVKQEYRTKYGEELERSIKKASHGEFGEFCLKLVSSG